MSRVRLLLDGLPPRVTRSEVLQFILETTGIDHRRLGKLELKGGQARVEIPAGWETRLVKAIAGAKLQKRRVRASIEGPASAAPDQREHFERMARLLELESRAEAQRAVDRGRKLSPADAQRTGHSLVDLTFVDDDAGLGGRYLVQLARHNRESLPWTRLDVGSPVVISQSSSAAVAHPLARGVICERTSHGVRVALDEVPEGLDEHDLLRIDLSNDEIAVARQRTALQLAEYAQADRLSELRDVLLGRREPEFAAPPDGEATESAADAEQPVADEASAPRLNASQREAVRFALSARDIALIHGPPGTGKTTTVAEAIRRLVERGEKVLASAPSNIGVDNLFERLLDAGLRAVRLGHPARVLPQLRANTLDLLVEEHHDVRLAHKLVKDALRLFRRADRYTRAKPKPRERQQIRQEAKSLLADARRLEAQAVEHILDTADVLCATTTGLDERLIGPRRFDCVVIDEACQSTEPGCWIPLAHGDRLILAGDHRQLPPTVISDEAQRQGFGVSLFERLAELYGDRLLRRLDVQYRMHADIMGFSSSEFYEGTLTADASVADHLLKDLALHAPGGDDADLGPLEFIDTAGAGYDEELEPDGESRLNRREAELLARQAHRLLRIGLPPRDIAVITPYAAQARLLRERLPIAGLEIDSVDGFQGREKEAVLISLVRSNAEGEIGFLADTRRMNVALTRARRRLTIIGDSATLSHDPFYQRLVEYFERLGAYRSVWEAEETTE